MPSKNAIRHAFKNICAGRDPGITIRDIVRGYRLEGYDGCASDRSFRTLEQAERERALIIERASLRVQKQTTKQQAKVVHKTCPCGKEFACGPGTGFSNARVHCSDRCRQRTHRLKQDKAALLST